MPKRAKEGKKLSALKTTHQQMDIAAWSQDLQVVKSLQMYECCV